MEMRNAPQHYTLVTKVLHWLIAVLVFIMLVVGYFLGDIAPPLKSEIVNLHKLIGLTILFLMVFRLIWRCFHVTPPLPQSVPRWQAILARLIHWLLYLAVIVMPLAGWIMTSASRHFPQIDGWQMRLPGIPNSEAVNDFFWQVHETVAIVLIILISLHTLAALKHLLINRDGVFQRMWFS